MNPLEYQKNILGELQKELRTVSAKRKSLKERIKNQINIIESLKEPVEKYIHPNTDLINRDFDLCYAFIKSNKRVTSRQIIDMLNIELEHQIKRWPRLLDGNLFMGKVGNTLLQRGIKRETDPNNKNINYWEII